MDSSPAAVTCATFFGCDPDGSTGSRLGTGTLVGEAMVVVHPPFSDSLSAPGRAPRLRVGLHASDRAVEVVDILDVRVSEGLVFAELARPVAMPTLPIPGAMPNDPAGAVVQTTLRSYLQNLPGGGTELPPVHQVGQPMSVFCWLFHHHCGSSR